MGQKWDNSRTRIARHADQLRQFGHLVLICAAVMFVLCIALSWILENTDLLAVASRQLPVAPGAVDRARFNAAAAVQSLDTLPAGLPVLIILLITAGALHPVSSAYQVTEVGQPRTSRNARPVE